MSLIESSNSKENISVLLNDIKNGKSDSFLVLVNLFRNRITSISCSFGLTETEREDLVQEGYIALYKAALTYDSSKGASFQTYVTVCAKRRMINWIEQNINKVSFSLPLSSFDDSELDKLAVSSDCLEDDVILKAQVADLTALANKMLSDNEKNVFDLYIKEYSPNEICMALNMTKKSYDNALYRIRSKLRSATNS